MARILFFCIVLRKLSEISNNKPILISTIFFTIMNISFFSLRFDLFSSQSNQEQCSLCCSSPCFRVLLLCTHYGSLQCFSTYFRKLKEIGVLRPVFPDYFISCDCGETHQNCFLSTAQIKRARKFANFHLH